VPSQERATLLVFSLAPEAGCDRRPLLPRRLRRLERDLRQRCLEQTLRAGRAAGLDLELATPGASSEALRAASDVRVVPQTGATFADRVREALHRSWSRHPEGPILLVGADTPELGVDHLLGALERLRRDPEAVVVGPSPDGGFYLLAAARPLDAALDRVRWCGAHARADLVASLERMGRPVVLLEPLADLDRPSDLLALLARAPGAVVWLARRIRAALGELARPLEAPPAGHLLGDLASVRTLRGPPA
jgi:glycosyltransferase A (GT-A) superfamily protein (DUF2064 family)